MRARVSFWQGGFTLIEAIMVITITGILAAIVAVFIRAPVDGYIDSVVRAELTDAADTALRRIARDVRTALPNSLRTTTGGSTACFEFLPTVGGGRYRVSQNDTGVGDVLDFSVADTSFQALAGNNLPPAGGYATQHHVVIYNLGIAGADAYDVSGRNRAAISTTSAASPIMKAGSLPRLPLASAARLTICVAVTPGHRAVYVWGATPFLNEATRLETLGKLTRFGFSRLLLSFTPGAAELKSRWWSRVLFRLSQRASEARDRRSREGVLRGDDWMEKYLPG